MFTVVIGLGIHLGASARERARMYEQLSSSGPSSEQVDVANNQSKPSQSSGSSGSDDMGVDESTQAKLLLKAKKKAEKEAQKAFEEQARLELER